MHTKNHENCSQIECFMSQKPLAPKFLSQTVDILNSFFGHDCIYIYIYTYTVLLKNLGANGFWLIKH